MPQPMNEQTRNFVYDCVMDAIEHLPEEQQYVFILQVIEGYWFKEIAELTGESINMLMALRASLKEVREIVTQQ